MIGKRLGRVVADTAVFGILFGIANVLSFVYLVVAGQSLAPGQFGVFNALVGVLTLAGVLSGAVQTAVTQVAVLEPTRAALIAVTRTTWRVTFPAVGLATLAALPFAGSIGATGTQALLCGGTALAMILAGASMGYLVGIRRQRLQAGIILLGTVLRLGAGWPLMLLQFGVAGAISGYLLQYMLALAVAHVLSLRLAPDRGGTAAPPDLRIDVRSIATFVAVFLPYTVDQVIVQTVAPQVGGDYAAIATVAKMIFLSNYPIIAVAYPHLLSLTDRHRQLRFAGVALAGVVGAAGLLCVVLVAFPDFAMHVFFHGRFAGATPLLGAMALGVTCFTVSTLGAHFLIAWGNGAGWLPSLAAQAVGIGLYAAHHESLDAVVANQLAIYVMQLVLMGIFVAYTIARLHRSGRAARP